MTTLNFAKNGSSASLRNDNMRRIRNLCAEHHAGDGADMDFARLMIHGWCKPGQAERSLPIRVSTVGFGDTKQLEGLAGAATGEAWAWEWPMDLSTVDMGTQLFPPPGGGPPALPGDTYLDIPSGLGWMTTDGGRGLPEVGTCCPRPSLARDNGPRDQQIIIGNAVGGAKPRDLVIRQWTSCMQKRAQLRTFFMPDLGEGLVEARVIASLPG